MLTMYSFFYRGYALWNAPLGGQVPCYSSLSSYLVPPAIPVASHSPTSLPNTARGNDSTRATLQSSITPQNPTSAIVNVVFAMQYLVQPISPGLSPGAEASIGTGAGVAVVAIITILFLVWRRRKHKKDKQTRATIQTAGPDSTRQSQSVMPSKSIYNNSTGIELQTDAVDCPVQAQKIFVPYAQGELLP
jgi:hypothetical protein